MFAVPARAQEPRAIKRVTLMPDPDADACVWDSEEGALREDELLALGVSQPLIQRLRAWLEAYDPPVGTAPDPEAVVGLPWSLRLAEQLQRELAGYEIHLSKGPDSRPFQEWTS
jgi:hypothetical protein